jgi:spore germination protein GerM
MNLRDRPWVVWTVAGFAVAAIGVVVLLNLRSTQQPVRYRVDLSRRGPELSTVTLYYLDADSLKLVPVQREVVAAHSRRELAQDLVAYLAEPAGKTRSPLPPGTRLLNFFENGSGQATMNFNAQIEYLEANGIEEEELRLTALTRTLGENLSGVVSVRLLVLGRPLSHWGSHLRPEGPLEVEPS